MNPFVKLTILAIITFSMSACVAHEKNVTKHSEVSHPVTNGYLNDSMTRTGIVEARELVSRYKKFKKSYQSFEPEAKDVKNIHLLKDMDVVVFFGLWCHDSQREVPRLIKLIEQSNNPFKSVKLIALNTKKEVSKEYADQFKVTHTPTLFVLKDGQLLAKIVERPKGSITQDLLGQILH